MKKFLLFVMTMLCAVSGAWAQDPATEGTFGSNSSTWKLDGTVLTLTFKSSTDKPIGPDQWGSPNAAALCDLTGVTKVIVITDSGVTLSGGDGSTLKAINDYYKTVLVLDLSGASINTSESYPGSGIYVIPMAGADCQSFKNVIAPSSYSNSIGSLRISNIYNPNQHATANMYSLSGTTVNAVYYTDASVFATLSTLSSDATKMTLANDVTGSLDLSSVLVSGKTLDLTNVTTTGTTSTNPITVASGVSVICLTQGVADRISGVTASVVNPVISCTAEELSSNLTALANNGVTATSITITSGQLTSEMLNSMNISGLKRLDLKDATLASGVTVANIPVSSTLEELVLPQSATPKTDFDAFKSNIANNNTLYYVYAPYNGTRNASQAVPDYVYMNRQGGMAKAVRNEQGIRQAVYIKCDSKVLMTAEDLDYSSATMTAAGVSFDTSSATDYPWQYCDFSGALLTTDLSAAVKAPHNKSYRVILPNGLNGDQLASYAATHQSDGVAAVYSYNGTTLNILEIHDATYHTDALNDSRIVRDGTTEVKMVSGTWNNITYSKFGPNLCAALSGAKPSIKKATIAVGTGLVKLNNDDPAQATAFENIYSDYTFTISNTNLTDLTLSYLSNQYVTFYVVGCTALTNLEANETTLKSIVANGITTLTTVDMGHATIGGDVDFSGCTTLNSLEPGMDNIGGTLNVSGTALTSLDLSDVTVKSVNASNTNSMTSLNLNGITLNGMGSSPDDISTDNITNRIGTLEVTRSGGDYSNLTIAAAPIEAFDRDRIVPKLSDISDDAKKYKVNAIEPSRIEITAAGSSLGTNAPAAVTTYNNAQNPVETNTVANVQILHVTGTLTVDDITYIKNNLTALQLLDLSGCTYADGVPVSSLSGNIPTTTAIVLPGTTNTEADRIADMKTLQDAGYECVAYYTHKATDASNFSSLNVYGYNSTVAKLKSTNGAIVSSKDRITFLRRYQNTDVNSASHGYPLATPSLLGALAELGATQCVDLTWMDISNLGTDFSGVDTRHLIIPQNTLANEITRNGILYNNDFTVEDNGSTRTSTDSYKYYKYHDNVYAVSTYKGKAAPYANMAYFGGDAMMFEKNNYGGKNSTACLTYLRTQGAGHLSDVVDLMNTEQTAANMFSLVGTVDANEMAGLNKLQNPCIDLTRATIADFSTLNSLDNDYVVSVSMPYKSVPALESDPTTDIYNLSTLPTLSKEACPNLKGVGMLVKSEEYKQGTSGSQKSQLIYQSYEEGGMGNQMLMLHAVNQNQRKYVISRMTVGGPVVARDLSIRENGIDKNGHLITSLNATTNKLQVSTDEIKDDVGDDITGYLIGYTYMEWWDLSKVTLPTYTEGDNVAEGNRAYRFDNATRDYATGESSASGFSYQNDLCFAEIGIAAPTLVRDNVQLPRETNKQNTNNVWRLPDGALNTCGLIDNLCIPHNYEQIGAGAFLNSSINHITTTDAAGALIDNGDHTYTLSANIKKLGNAPVGTSNITVVDGQSNVDVTNATIDNNTVFPHGQQITDVYVLATKTPICYKNTFPADILYGWGGFDGMLPYCRDKYHNGSDWFAVLRFPSQESWAATAAANKDATYAQMKQQYTDVNKVYTKMEQTGAVDANGDPIAWPTFAEMKRVYNQATMNLTWNDWTTTYDGQQQVEQGGQNPIAKEGNTGTLDPSGIGSKAAGDKTGDYDFAGYEGWHQFVLSQATYVEPDEVTPETREYEDAGWFTFCIPYDMTKKQVCEWLGVPASAGNITCKYGEEVVNEAKMPDIRQLQSVTRHKSTGSGDKNVVKFRLTTNLYNGEAGHYLDFDRSKAGASRFTTASAGGTGDSDPVLRGGIPYIIKAYKRKGEKIKSYNLGQYIMTRYGDQFKQTAACLNRGEKFYEYLGASSGDKIVTLKFSKPYEEAVVVAADDAQPASYLTYNDNGTSRPYEYALVGTFWNQKLPRYCFYQSKGTWYRNTNENNYQWSAYKCVIMAVPTVAETSYSGYEGHNGQNYRVNPSALGAIEGGKSFYPSVTGTDKLNGTLKIVFADGRDDDDFQTSGSNARYAFAFDDGIMEYDENGEEVTAIDRLDGGDIVPTDGKVYNMAGQYVGNNLNALGSGLYIVNGKKIVVK